MKIERKIMISIGLVALLLIGYVLSGIGTRTITSTSDTMLTQIVCSNGNTYDATWANVVAAASSLTGNGWIKLTPVTYTVTSTVTINTYGVMIYGNGATLDFSGYNGKVFSFVGTTSSIPECGVCDCHLIGDRTKTSQEFANFTNCYCDVYNCNNTGESYPVALQGEMIYRFVSIYGVSSGSRIHDNRVRCVQGVYITSTDGTSSTVNGSEIYGNWFDGLYVSGTSTIATSIGIYISGGYGNQITGNHIGGDDYWHDTPPGTKGFCYGVKCTGTMYDSITGNFLWGALEGIYLTSCNYESMTGNTFESDYGNSQGIYLGSCIHGITISGNTIRSAFQNYGWDGIFLSSCRNVTICGNTITQDITGSHSTCGINGSGTTNSELCITGNTITTGGGTTPCRGMDFGTLVNSEITNNQLHDWVTYNIYIATNTTNLVINNHYTT